HSIWIVAAIQAVTAPSGVIPPVWRLAGAMLIVGGVALAIAARRVNYWFVPVVIYVPLSFRATTGADRFCRHPGYCGFALSAWGTFFLLGQPWAYFPTLAYLLLLSYRISLEDKILSK